MNYRTIPAPLLMISSAILLSSSIALGADGEQGIFNRLFGPGEAPGVAPVDNPLYLQECGSCHFAYQPGLLPARSWNNLMGGLENHFGENAELPAG
ncbi:MAG TPA: cytochrome C, partial [Gammaproteobacteria bacterium]|nr:cytochrome C [Gammaproteobacteria bacterium]